jgi:MFS family permease
MSFSTLEEKEYSYKVKPDDAKDNDSASVWSESTVDGMRPSRLYQSALLFAGFMTTFQTIGMNQSYGVFQDYYTSSDSPIVDARAKYAMVSLIGTIGSGLTWSGSIFVSLIISSGCDLRLMCLSGATIMSLGLLLSSLATKLWQLFITQAFLFGVGSSMLYYPMTSLTPQFFDKHRGFAMGIALSGSGAGGLVFAPVTQALFDRWGASATLRILGVWNFIVLIPISFIIRRPPGYSPVRPSLALAKRGTFILQLFTAFLQAAGNIIPLYYLPLYSTAVLGFSPQTASVLLAVNNAANSVARVTTGLLADYVGRQNTMIACVCFSGASVLTLWFDAERGRFLAFVVLYGIGSGGYSALLPTTIAEIYGAEHYSAANAAIYFIRGFGAVFGAPVAGAILGTQNSHEAQSLADLRTRFRDVVGFDGILLVAAGVCVSLVRWFDARNKGRWRWRA